jgi:hypothetical protein
MLKHKMGETPTHINSHNLPWQVRGNILQTLYSIFQNIRFFLSYTLPPYLLKIKLLFSKPKWRVRHMLCSTSFTFRNKIFKVVFIFILALKQFICFLDRKSQNLCSLLKIIFLQNTILLNFIFETYIVWAPILLRK